MFGTIGPKLRARALLAVSGTAIGRALLPNLVAGTSVSLAHASNRAKNTHDVTINVPTNVANGVAGLDSSGNLVGTIVFRLDTAANLASVVLAQGQPGYATDTGQFAVGDGTTTFANLGGMGGHLIGSGATVNNCTLFGNAITFGNDTANARGLGAIDLQPSTTTTVVAAGKNSTAIGTVNSILVKANGSGTPIGSFAIGNNNRVYEFDTTWGAGALGGLNVVAGSVTLAVGSGNTCVGGGTALGNSNKATGFGSVALGGGTAGFGTIVFTLSGSTATVTGLDVTGFLGLATSNTVFMYALTGGTANTQFSASGSISALTFSGGNTTFTVGGTLLTLLGDRTGGNVAPSNNGPSFITKVGQNAVALGPGQALANYSTAIGRNSLAYLPGQLARSSGQVGLTGNGTKQNTRSCVCGQTTSTTAVNLNADGGTANFSIKGDGNSLFVISGKMMSCTLHLAGRSTSGAGHASFIRRFVIQNTTGTVALVGSVATIGTDISDAGGSTWTVAITADNTNKVIQIAVTGSASTTTQWSGTLDSEEIVF